jgi:hypothetical protein
MELRKVKPIYDETQALQEFNDFFRQHDELLSKELDKLNTEIKKIDDNKLSDALIPHDHNEVYTYLITLKNEYESLKVKYGLEHISLNDIDSRKKYYSDKIKHYFYSKNISLLTDKKSVENSIREVYTVITFHHVFEVTYKVLLEKLSKELRFDTELENIDYRLIYYWFYSNKKIEFKHDLNISEGNLEFHINRLKESENENKELKNEIEELRNELSTKKTKLLQLQSYNNIIPNQHFQDFIIKIEYCDFRPLYTLISEWNLFINENGNLVSFTHLIYVFDEINSEKGLFPLPVNFTNSVITIEEFGLFLYRLKEKLIKPRFYATYEQWYNTHFDIKSKHGNSVTDITRYVKPYKKQLEKNQMKDYLQQFLSSIGIS